MNSLLVCINRCLRRIVNVHWPDRINNNDLRTKTDQEPALIQIKRRKCSWLGHTLQRNDNSIVKQALQWKPQDTRRGRPRTTLPGGEIWSQKWGQQDSSTAGGRWKRRLQTGLDREMWSVWPPLEATRLKSSQLISFTCNMSKQSQSSPFFHGTSNVKAL